MIENKDFIFYYFIVYDEEKERVFKDSKHLHNPLLGDIVAALTYCLHLPRAFFDVIEAPEKLFLEGGLYFQHEIHLIPSKLTQQEKDKMSKIRPTLYITESSCYESACKIHHEYSSILGCVSIEDLCEDLLSVHWEILSSEVIKYLNNATKLNFITRLFEKKHISALPNLYLTNQLSSSEKLIEVLINEDYSFEARSYILRYEKAKLMLYYDLGKNLGGLSDKQLHEEFPKIVASIGVPLIITLPGGPNKRQSYGSIARDISEQEEDIINFFGVQNAISEQGVWLKAKSMTEHSFRLLSLLEKRFHARKQNHRFIIRAMKRFGKDLIEAVGTEKIKEYIADSSKVIAFTDFPIGLAILPGYSDPLCCMVPISYRPLTPLSVTFQRSLARINDYYIGAENGLNVMIVECLSREDKIRPIADLGWNVVCRELETNPLIQVQYRECESIKRLDEVLEESSHIDIMVISAHGTYDAKGVAGLSIGDEFWLPKNGQKVPPIIILSACHVAPKGQGEYTISDALLREGALAVLGTLIPVSVKHNAILTQRFFQFIFEILEGRHQCFNLADAWKRVIAMNAMTEVVCASKELEAWALRRRKSGGTVFDEYFLRIQKKPIFPGHIYDNTIEILKDIASEDGMSDYIDHLLNSQGYVSESFFYVFSGFAEDFIEYTEKL
ncbi:hypothetical protein ACFVQB_27765 [Paenibacillus sp. NPDC057886]|uniref:hypothetical protein n=1 Tax=Paenibacillus sp. NPDC057886 TaxID=3346270 RepID=UPI0036A15A42